MALKASILIATYNKERELPNVLHSISRQKVDFEFEVCILDDCSRIDPKPLVDEYLTVPRKVYSRLRQHMGDGVLRSRFKIFDVTSSYGYAFRLSDPSSPIVVLQSADVIWVGDNILQSFVDRMEPRQIQLCTVVNLPVNPNLHADWDGGIGAVIAEAEKTDSHYQGRWRGGKPGRPQGPRQHGEWFPFLAPFYRADLADKDMLGLEECALDTHLSGRMHAHGFEPVWREDLLGVHQAHANEPRTIVMSDECLRNWMPYFPQREVYE